MTPPAQTFGRRGAMLLTFGVLWLIQGVQTILYHQPVPHVWLMSHGWQWQAAAWILAGATAIWASTRKAGRDWLGFMALYVMGFWIFAVLADGLIEAILEHSGATPALLLSASKNACILAFIVIANGWREPLHLPAKEDRP